MSRQYLGIETRSLVSEYVNEPVVSQCRFNKLPQFFSYTYRDACMRRNVSSDGALDLISSSMVQLINARAGA